MKSLFSDSDWARNKSSRKGASAGTTSLDGQVVYTLIYIFKQPEKCGIVFRRRGRVLCRSISSLR